VADTGAFRKRGRLEDILEHTRAARDILARLSKDQFLSDTIVQKAVCFDLLCISEATARLLELDSGIAQRHGDVPWPQVRAIANVLRHEYDRIDMDIVWDTIRAGDLDTLTVAVERELELLNS
jgi:uncharacterized protein with HEPN domain